MHAQQGVKQSVGIHFVDMDPELVDKTHFKIIISYSPSIQLHSTGTYNKPGLFVFLPPHEKGVPGYEAN